MTRPHVLLLDMDGPLAAFDDHGFAVSTAAGLTFNVPGRHAQTARYYTDHMDDPDHVRAARAMIESSGWFRALPVVEGAQEGVDLLMSRFDVWVCTKPLEVNPTCRDEKGAWLREHFPMLERRLILAPDKSLIRGSILLDDAPRLSWLKRAAWKPVIFSEPFNGDGSKYAGFPHWRWGEPVEMLEAVAGRTLPGRTA